jgi:hypothetical protein
LGCPNTHFDDSRADINLALASKLFPEIHRGQP